MPRMHSKWMEIMNSMKWRAFYKTNASFPETWAPHSNIAISIVMNKVDSQLHLAADSVLGKQKAISLELELPMQIVFS